MIESKVNFEDIITFIEHWLTIPEACLYFYDNRSLWMKQRPLFLFKFLTISGVFVEIKA